MRIWVPQHKEPQIDETAMVKGAKLIQYRIDWLQALSSKPQHARRNHHRPVLQPGTPRGIDCEKLRCRSSCA